MSTMKTVAVMACAMLVLILVVSGSSAAEIPRKINYQGLLSDPGTGEPVVGTHTLTFKVYTADSGGDLLWSESKSVTPDQAGVFSTILGSVVPIDIPFDSPCWLEIEVNGEILTPRREMVSVPFAFSALNSDSLGGLSSASFSLTGHTHDEAYVNEGQDSAVTSAMVVPDIVSSIAGVTNDGGDIDLVAGTNITITPDDANDRITIEATGSGSGDITAVYADDGLSGGATEGEAHLSVNTGPGLVISGDAVGLTSDYSTGSAYDSHFVNEDQAGSVTGAMVVPDIVSSVDGVTNDGGNIDLVSGSNITITPNDEANTITIGVTGVGDGHSLDAADGTFTDVVYVADNGLVGIGFTTPTLAQLQVINATGEAIYGSSNDGAGVAGFSQNNSGILGISNNGKAGSFVGEVYVSGRVDSDSAFSIAGENLLRVTGQQNLLIGRHVGDPESQFSRTTCVGDSTGFDELGNGNTFVGYNAGHGNIYPPDINMHNVCVGAFAGYANYSADNVFVGHKAGRSNTNGLGNTFVGSSAGADVTGGGRNVFVGLGAGSAVTSGERNVICGASAGSSLETGGSNTLVGAEAGGTHSAGLGQTGEENTAVGAGAGFDGDGSGNVFLGFEAGYGERGSDKLYIANGKDTSDVLIYGDFATDRIGVGTLVPERKVHIKGINARVLVEASSGNAEVNLKTAGDAVGDVWAMYKESATGDLRFFQGGDKLTIEAVTGNVGVGTSNPGTCKLYVNGGAGGTTGWGACSDLRLKNNIESIGDALGKVLNIRGVRFEWRSDEYPERNLGEEAHFGVIAQEVEEIVPEIVTETVDGEKAVVYSELIPILIEAIKTQQNQIEILEARVAALEK